MGTEVYCVIGWPVHHSASPAMMNAVFADQGLDACYVPFAVKPAQLAHALRGLCALGVRGVNVTVPHKQSVMGLLDDVSDAARYAGAVNLVRLDPETGQMAGHNSDIVGWYRSVESFLPATCDSTVAVLGAGGAARGIITALALYTPHVRVSLMARRREQVQSLIREFGDRLTVQEVDWAHRGDAVSAADVVINATPIGMWPHVDASPIDDDACFHQGQIVQDIVYRPLTTRLLSQARSRGATTLDGLWMLVYQGAVSLEYWLGLTAPVDIMRAAAQAHVLRAQ